MSANALPDMQGRVHTYSGLWIRPLHMRPEAILPVDVAAHLGNQCRFIGGTREFYSVAQHAVIVSKLVPREFAREGLMHDAAEYLLGDMAKPLKAEEYLGRAYRGAEARLERVIAERFKLRYPWPECVHEADLRLLVTEARDLHHGTGDWGYYQEWEPYDFTIKAWTPPRARREFLKRFGTLFPEEEVGKWCF